MSVRKHTNEKTVRTVIKQDLSPDLNSLDHAIEGVLENKTNTTSRPTIGSLKIAIEEEWNKMPEESILKTCKSFRRRVDTTTETIGGHIE